MTIRTALAQGSELLDRAGIPEGRLTAEVLLGHAIHCDRAYFYAHPEQELREVEWLHYGRYLDERMKGKPTQYITKRQEFYGREFLVSRDVLLRWRGGMLTTGRAGKTALGLVLIATGVLVLTGYDKSIEENLVSLTPAWLAELTARF